MMAQFISLFGGRLCPAVDVKNLMKKMTDTPNSRGVRKVIFERLGNKQMLKRMDSKA